MNRNLKKCKAAPESSNLRLHVTTAVQKHKN